METNKIAEEAMDCESVEMEEHDSRQQKTKVPRRTIYFASGETMEEYSTDEEEEEEDLTKKQVATVDTSRLTWGPYFLFQTWRMATATISVCDYLGERLASLFGITTPKYQYALDEYYHRKKEEEEEEEENRLAEAAERHFEEQQRAEQDALRHATTEQPETAGHSFVNLSFEPEAPLGPADAWKEPSAPPSHSTAAGETH
ncbi:protein FAM177A1 isoform X1 [Takifugu flavidus]|nr:protein FAM177A1 isoform X1 [Takifugu flavidus]